MNAFEKAQQIQQAFDQGPKQDPVVHTRKYAELVTFKGYPQMTFGEAVVKGLISEGTEMACTSCGMPFNDKGGYANTDLCGPCAIGIPIPSKNGETHGNR